MYRGKRKITGMQNTAFKILQYLSGQSSPCGFNRIHDAFEKDISGEKLEKEIGRLKQAGYVEFLWDCCSAAGIIITDKGQQFLCRFRGG